MPIESDSWCRLQVDNAKDANANQCSIQIVELEGEVLPPRWPRSPMHHLARLSENVTGSDEHDQEDKNAKKSNRFRNAGPVLIMMDTGNGMTPENLEVSEQEV
jgi:hypothetical protein